MVKQRSKTKINDSSYKKFGKDSDESDGEEINLLVKNRSPHREIETVEKVLEDDDTLQSIAIRFRCTIEDLKRLNNIHKENEIYAKRTIKVPHRPFTAALAPIHVSGKSSPNSSQELFYNNQPSTSSTNSNLIDIDMIESKLFTDTTKYLRKFDKNSLVNDIIFNSSIAQKESLIDHTPDYNNSDEEVSLLPNGCDSNSNEVEAIVSKFNCSGADCDIPLVALVACIVIVIVAIPLIYVFYVAEHPEQFHHHVASRR